MHKMDDVIHESFLDWPYPLKSIPQNVVVAPNLLAEKTNKIFLLENKCSEEEMRARLDGCLVVYTDGSVKPSTGDAGAGICFDDGESIHLPAARCNTFSAEAFAIQQALQHYSRDRNVAILSDDSHGMHKLQFLLHLSESATS